MKKNFLLTIYLLTLSLTLGAQSCNWSELIGKQVVLFRYGLLEDGWFRESRIVSPIEEMPMEQLVLTDSTHFEWKYAISGDFTRECHLEGDVMNVNPPFFENRHLKILSREGNLVITKGEEGLTRAFYVQDSIPAPEFLPVCCNSEKGFCDGKLDAYLRTFTDFTYAVRTPMGRHFLFYLHPDKEEMEWLASTEESFNRSMGIIKALDVKLYPSEKPGAADVCPGRMEDCNAVSVLADMAFQYPEFIRSIIQQESPESFRVDMFDPMGKPIVVRVSNRFPVQGDGKPFLCVGKDSQPNWITILEKAAMKYIKVYQHINSLEDCTPEMLIPMFTGDGRSFCIRPSLLSEGNLAQAINTCLEYGLMVSGGFRNKMHFDGHAIVSKRGYSFLPPQVPEALYSIYNPWCDDEGKRILNVLSTYQGITPYIDLRIISPGAAAKYFQK